MTNRLKHQTLVIIVCANKFPMLDPFTTKLSTLMYYDKVSSKQKLQVCKQQQTASGNKNLFMFKTSLYWALYESKETSK